MRIAHCAVCKKMPHELDEYVIPAKERGIAPEAYVKVEEGTYNNVSGAFYCTDCYIDIGMPNGVAP